LKPQAGSREPATELRSTRSASSCRCAFGFDEYVLVLIAIAPTSIHSHPINEPQGAHMTIDRAVLAFAGTVVLVSLLLGIYVHYNWFWLTAFVGANLLQSSLTGFCPLAIVLRKMGVPQGPAF
jgi:hypothetical protein